MTRLSSVSPEISFFIEYDQVVNFKRHRKKGEAIPKAEKCKGALNGIYISGANAIMQSMNIESINIMFGIDKKNGIVTKIPRELEVIQEEGIKAIKVGKDVDFDTDMIKAACEAGVIGSWNNESFIICASPDYEFIIDAIKEMIKPQQVRIVTNESFCNGICLMILAA